MFYRITTDFTGWLLHLDPMHESAQIREFVYLIDRGQPMPWSGPLVPISCKKAAQPREFSFTVFGYPVVSSRIARLLEQAAPDEVQLFKAEIAGVGGGYEILNVTKRIDCLDEQASKLAQYRGPRQFEGVYELAIKGKAAGDAQIFRIDSYRIAIMVSAKLKETLERAGIHNGVAFVPVKVT